MPSITYGNLRCACAEEHPSPRLIAISGGPGAGKTAVLHVAARTLCEHVAILPEAAGVAFEGGFPRDGTQPGREAAQRAIYHIQHELERLVIGERRVAAALCDRGTLDGLAYWPAEEGAFWTDVCSSREEQIKRYAAVIHLRTPGASRGYDHKNPLRIESPQQARAIDDRILAAWSAHPNRTVIDSADEFLDKVNDALRAIRAALPSCCCAHPVTGEGASTL